jgi:hypothetical protein
MKKIFTIVIICLVSFGVSKKLRAQEEESKVKPKIGFDLVSNYVWRGTDPGPTQPHFQPTVAVTIGNLEIGAWGSTSFSGDYTEADLYATYTAGPVTLGLYDYCWTATDVEWKYFDYSKKTTPHIYEATLGYKGKNVPISLTAGLMFYGADKKATDPTKNNYSSYFEVGYSFKNFDAFVGATGDDGYYGDGYGKVGGFAVVNMGVTGYKKLKITESFELPIKVSFIANPQREKAWLVVGVSF